MRFPPIEPHAHGLLPVGEGNEIYWETSGNPAGKPALHLHGGPGGGMSSGYRRDFDPEKYLIIGLDQRGCGRSRPLVSADPITLANNTTQHLIADIEALRTHLGLDRWLVFGASWGTTLALAYAQAHPGRVTEIALMATTLTNPEAVEWITETVGRLFPVEWDAFRSAAAAAPGRRLVDAYHDLLGDPDEQVRTHAIESWMAWERAHITMGTKYPPRQRDSRECEIFVRLVVHYWRHGAFLPPTALREGISTLHGIPAVLVQGKLDVSGPAAVAWELHKAWPGSRFILIEDEGHGGPRMTEALCAAIDEFADGRH
ncbi:prolyl aminopeptidase [Nocardia sp. NPDC052254]|uniref:prolyl aminopeptidase n=1 Tax=Nocardia sp. NPDC052254 TaxID=3155681 RepID=UPI003418C843